MDQEMLDRIVAVTTAEGTLAERMGIKILSASGAEVVATMPVAGNIQPYGLLHGGASCVLAETIGSLGAALHAGSVLLRGRIVVRASAVGSDTAIGRIIARVEQAQEDRAPIQTVGDTFSRRFVPASFALSALTLLLTGDVRRAGQATDRRSIRSSRSGGTLPARHRYRHGSTRETG